MQKRPAVHESHVGGRESEAVASLDPDFTAGKKRMHGRAGCRSVSPQRPGNASELQLYSPRGKAVTEPTNTTVRVRVLPVPTLYRVLYSCKVRGPVGSMCEVRCAISASAMSCYMKGVPRTTLLIERAARYRNIQVRYEYIHI